MMPLCAIEGDPTPARVTILVVFALGYALYHLLRWYAARPKVEKEEVQVESPSPREELIHSSTPTQDSNLQPPTSNLEPPTSSQPQPSTSTSSPSSPSLFTPDEIRDFERKGKAAWSAGWLVEAYFWTTLARANGVHGLASRLSQMERAWAARGFPNEEENRHAGYMHVNAGLALAHMLFRCGMAPRENAAHIVAQAHKGNRVARSLAIYDRLIRG